MEQIPEKWIRKQYLSQYRALVEESEQRAARDGRRSPEQLEALELRILHTLFDERAASKRGGGYLRIGVLSERLDEPVAALRRPLQNLVAKERVIKEGVKRSTVYRATGRRPRKRP
jgi:hypothetical protein